MTQHTRIGPLALAFALAASPAAAAVHGVPGSFPTITAALAAASPGDTVTVAAGTYSPSSNGEVFPLVIADAGVHLLGAGIGASVLDAESTAGVIEFDPISGGGEIRGFTITGGAALHGGGVRVKSGDPEIHENFITANSATGRGAGVHANTAAPWIHHNVVWANFDGNPLDTSDPHGVIIEGTATGIFEHNVVGRGDGNGMLTSGTAVPAIRHNIFLQNGIPGPPARGRGICSLSTTAPQIYHNLFFANQLAALLWPAAGGNFSGAAANAVSAVDGVYGNLDGDPLLADADSGDFSLTAGSPAIDAGDPALPFDPDGTVADIGAYYFHQNGVGAPEVAAADDMPLMTVPNPFRETTEVRFALPEPTSIRVEVHDVAGRLVRTLAEGGFTEGAHAVPWDGHDRQGREVGAGIYFVRVANEHTARTVPVVHLK